MLTFLSFVFFTALVGVIVYMMTRNDRMTDSDAYFLGGRSLGAWVIAGSLVLTNLSTEHLIGLNGDAFRHTIAVMAWETTAALAMVLMALFFLPRYLRRGFTTIPQFIAERYDQQTATIATCLFLLSYILAILPVVLLSGATGLESLFDLSQQLGISRSQGIWLSVWGVGTLGSLYAIFGGLRAVALSDTINGVGFLIAGLLIPVLGLIAIGQGSLVTGMTELYTSEHPKFDITGNEPHSFLPFGVLFTGMIVNQVFFWCANQQIVQRTFAAKSLEEGQKGVLIAAGFKLLGPVVVVLPGVIAFHMFGDRLAGDDAYLRAYPELVKAVLPPYLIGFFAAVMVGAILSTFNSVLNSSATLFSKDIYAAILNRNPSQRQLVRAGRICSIILALGAMATAPLIDSEGGLYNYLQKINATFFGPLLAVLILGFFTRSVSSLAAKVALIGGPIAFYLLVFQFGEGVQSLLRGLLGHSDDIHFLHFLALIFLATSALMLIISRFRPADTVYDPKSTGEVDLKPWRHVRFASAILCSLTIGCYILLAQ